MTKEDLEYIFREQFDNAIRPEFMLYFMLIDGEHILIERHNSSDIDSLIPMLDSFQYVGDQNNIPRFQK